MIQIEKSDRYIISDTHFGHAKIHNFRKLKNASGSLMSAEEQHEALYETLLQVPKRATLWLLGDIAFSKEWLQKIKDLPCRNKVLVAGNHCTQGEVTMRDLVDTYEKVFALTTYKKHWMSHAPIHPMELRGRSCVHGHMHPYLVLGEDGLPDNRYRSVCCEYTNYRPIPWTCAISDEYQQECLIKWKEYMRSKENDRLQLD